VGCCVALIGVWKPEFRDNISARILKFKQSAPLICFTASKDCLTIWDVTDTLYQTSVNY
jgi:hypothetical protein